jgi:soluble lytic murein transglycosylase-like protein
MTPSPGTGVELLPVENLPVAMKSPARSPAMLPVAWYGDEAAGVVMVQRWLADYRTGLSPMKKRQVAEALYRESQRHGFPPSLVVALMATESSAFNWSRSEQGAVGLMQLLPLTAEAMVSEVSAWSQEGELRWHGEEMLFDPLVNIKLGLRYLAYLNRQFGDVTTALTAYNYGPTRVSQWLDACEPLPLSYANRVLGLSQVFHDRAQTEST